METTPTTPAWAGGEPFKIENDEYAWCEDFEAHFWDVGGAADLLNLRYTGWYLEDDGDSGETAVAVALEAKAEAGEDSGIYHAAILDPVNDGAAMVSIETYTDAKDAAYRANESARMYAEAERDYRAAWSAATLAADTLHELSELYEDSRQIEREPERPVAKAVRAQIERMIRRIRQAGDDRWRNVDCFDDTFAENTGQSYDDALAYLDVVGEKD